MTLFQVWATFKDKDDRNTIASLIANAVLALLQTGLYAAYSEFETWFQAFL